MQGDQNKNDKNFTPDNYEEFYENHFFRPIDADLATSVDTVYPRFKWAIDHIQAIGPKNLLDIGCLDGSFALTVARKLQTTVMGIDLSVDGIRLAKERTGDLPAKFEQGSAEVILTQLARQKKKFDVITLFEVIEHVEDVPKLLKLIDKVLAPGGSVLLSTPEFEGPIYGLDDEQNTCHIRLYTMQPEDYEKENKFGHIRKATSMPKEIGETRIQEMTQVGEQICVYYK
jgi:2-polyprenyl-3-methyl-5-hydroxy-6-metoxy-1,4-benzoquinol methylase